MELIQRIREAVSQPYHKLNKELLCDLYEEFFVEKLDRTCPRCTIRAYNSLATELDKLNITMAKKTIEDTPSGYIFTKEFEGSTIIVPAKGWYITGESLTSEQAEWLLASPGHAGMLTKGESAEPAKV